ncbi:MAG: glycosyltransferase family A protein [Marinobacter sp.]
MIPVVAQQNNMVGYRIRAWRNLNPSRSSATICSLTFDASRYMTKLSIIIPTHNRPDMLAKAIESAVDQSLSDLEVIVVDDGSSVPVDYEGEDERVRVHRHSIAQGVSAARNAGLSLANGEYIAFLDDDDTLLPDYAGKMLELFEQYGDEIDFAWPALRVLDVSSGDTSEAQQHSCLIRRHHKADEVAYAATAYTRTTGMMFRAESIRRIGGFDESLTVSEDRELVFRMLSEGSGCGSVQAPLVNFFIHSGPRLSTSDNLLKQAKCDTLIADRHAGFIAQHPKLASRYLNLLARRQKDAGLIADYRSTLLRLLRIRPLDVRALKRLMLSLFLSSKAGGS